MNTANNTIVMKYNKKDGIFEYLYLRLFVEKYQNHKMICWQTVSTHERSKKLL